MEKKSGNMSFNFLEIPTRSKKPRSQGLTIVIDGLESGFLSLRELENLMEVAADYIDFMKVGWLTATLQPKDFVKSKNKICRENDIYVFPGGMLLEWALTRGKIEQFFKECKELGFTAIEVSDSVITLSIDQKIKLIKMAKNFDFKVLAEVGKKFPETPYSSVHVINEINKLLDAGAFKVILESEEVELLFTKNKEKAETYTKTLLEIASAVDPKDIIFEVPYGKSYTELCPILHWFISHFGSEVNLANIEPNHVVALETLRRGLDVLGFGRIISLEGQSTDY